PQRGRQVGGVPRRFFARKQSLAQVPQRALRQLIRGIETDSQRRFGIKRHHCNRIAGTKIFGHVGQLRERLVPEIAAPHAGAGIDQYHHAAVDRFGLGGGSAAQERPRESQRQQDQRQRPQQQQRQILQPVAAS